MEQAIEKLENQVATLNSWIGEMTAIISNPYSAGLNVERMLNDLKGFGEELMKNVEVVKEARPIEAAEVKKAEKASK